MHKWWLELFFLVHPLRFSLSFLSLCFIYSHIPTSVLSFFGGKSFCRFLTLSTYLLKVTSLWKYEEVVIYIYTAERFSASSGFEGKARRIQHCSCQRDWPKTYKDLIFDFTDYLNRARGWRVTALFSFQKGPKRK